MAKQAPAHRSWFRIVLRDTTSGALSLVAAAGEHLGAAIAAAEAHAPGSVVAAAIDAKEADIPLGESLGKQSVVVLGDVDPAHAPPAFAWPVGIVPALGPELAKIAAATAGFAVVQAAAPFVIEAQVARADVGEVFMSLIEKVPAADNLEIKMMPHGDGGGGTAGTGTDVWLTSRVNTRKIITFLDERDAELFGNGHIEIAVYVRAKKATLKLTEHKTIAWVADDGSLEADVTAWLTELGVPPVAALVRASSVPHFHYRPAKSRDRAKLSDELYRQRLRRVARMNVQAPRERD